MLVARMIVRASRMPTVSSVNQQALRAMAFTSSHQHFRASNRQHPLGAAKPAAQAQAAPQPTVASASASATDAAAAAAAAIEYERQMGDHTGRQQNHIWTEAEIADVRENMWKHKPDTFSDHVANRFMRGLYVAFNYITGYRHDNPTPASIGWRLMVLESVAGVPGFLAAAVRHFRSLRTMRDDHGWINSLLEEAENERMHLIVCIRVFEASYVTRALVLAAQCVMTPFLLSLYIVHPKLVHRFVGYLEETAVHTYNNIIDHCERPGTLLHTAWKDVPAPEIAKAYWKLHDNAMLVDALKCMCADEANHRDVNHTFAAMRGDDPNPFLMAHKHDASIAWRLENQGAHAWESKTIAIGTPTAAPASKSSHKPAL